MYKTFSFLLCLGLIPLTGKAGPLLKDHERAAIVKALEIRTRGERGSPSSPGICLNAHIFIDEENWTIWINNHQLTAQQKEPLTLPFGTVSVQSVRAEGVTLLFQPHAHPEHVEEICLSPCQTYLLEDQKINPIVAENLTESADSTLSEDS